MVETRKKILVAEDEKPMAKALEMKPSHAASLGAKDYFVKSDTAIADFVAYIKKTAGV